jgi:8-oxo-dGTP diphosphatase
MSHESPRMRATLATMDESGRILLLQHIHPDRHPYREYWVLPGGGVEYGESVEKALEREIREELGIGVQVGNLLAIGELITGHLHVLDLFLTGILDRHDGFTIQHDEGIGEARWVELEMLAQMDFLPREILPILIGWAKGVINGPVYMGKYNSA